jgi:hypothetical protein
MRVRTANIWTVENILLLVAGTKWNMKREHLLLYVELLLMGPNYILPIDLAKKYVHVYNLANWHILQDEQANVY